MNRFSGYFASGSNKAGEIAGLATIGRNVGVAVNEVNEAAIVELEKLAGTDLIVFVDSGAFGEVGVNLWVKNKTRVSKKRPTGLRDESKPADAKWLPRPDLPIGAIYVKKAITDAEWNKRLAIYKRLAEALGPQLYCVAPDRVGDQAETLERLRSYRWQVLQLRRLGAKIIVPLQRGALSQAEFAAEVENVLGFGDWVRGVPMCKAATSLEELAELAATLEPGTKIHLLGKGPYSDDHAKCLAAAAHLDVTCDSVRITALVGRHNGPGGGPRALTIAQDEVRAELVADGVEATGYRVTREAVIRVLGPETRAAEIAARVASKKVSTRVVSAA